MLRIVSPDGTDGAITVEVKSRLFPREVPDLKRRFEAYVGVSDVLVVSRFLSPASRRRLTEERLNYLDLTGNVRLVVSQPGLFIETQGALTDPEPAEKTMRSLRGAKAGRLVRALCDFPLPLSITDLGLKAGVDVSYASRLVEWLAREALLTRASRGPVMSVDRPQILRRWANDYSVLKSNAALSCLEPRGLEALLRRLPSSSFRYAVTGSLAANRLAPIAPARLAMIYVDDPDNAAGDLSLVPVETGANVMLLGPFDEVVFDRTRVESGVTYVAPSQAAVDLLTGPGRSPAEGEAILEMMAANGAL